MTTAHEPTTPVEPERVASPDVDRLRAELSQATEAEEVTHA